MHRRAAQHEVRADNANLSTVLQQANVLRRGMVAALLEAVGNRRKANRVAIETIGNTVLHGGHGVLLHRENEALAPKFPGSGRGRVGTSSGLLCLTDRLGRMISARQELEA